MMFNEMHAGTPTRADRAALCHFWRVVGFHLGLHDEFNPCASLELQDAMAREFIAWVPTRLATARPCTFELQRAAVEGFGEFTGIGVDGFAGLLEATTRAKGVPPGYLKTPASVGVRPLGGVAFLVLASGVGNRALGTVVTNYRDRCERDPEAAHTLMRAAQRASRASNVLWRFFGVVLGWPLSFLEGLALRALAPSLEKLARTPERA